LSAEAGLAASIHARLLQKARQTGRTFNELLQYFGMERFLYRLSQSVHRDRFILKGALMLNVWDAPLTRPTMDIDLLGRLRNDLGQLAAVVQDPNKTKQWNAFLRKIRANVETVEFDSTIDSILAFLGPVVAAVSQGEPFTDIWTAPGPWNSV